MKHVILVEGSGTNSNVLQKTINILDDPDIDFVIHWDKKSKKPRLVSNKSSVKFIKQTKNNWGGDTQISVMKKLLQAVKDDDYDYVHLISESDIPLMTPEYFKHFFNKDTYLEYCKVDDNILDRVRYFYLTGIINLRSDPFKIKHFLHNFLLITQKMFKINRLRNKHIRIEKGCNWFTFSGKCIKEILDFDDSFLTYSFLGDELYIQTILRPKHLENSDLGCCRYIDWKRGNPYTYTIADVDELKNLVNTKYAFARKVKDDKIVDAIFENY